MSRILRSVAALCALPLALAAGAQPTQPDAVAEERARVREELVQARDPGLRTLLERIDNLLLRQQTLIERREDLSRAEAAMQEKLAAGPESDVSGTPPYPVALLDLLADALDGLEHQLPVLEAAERAAGTALERARQELREAEQRRRKATEEAEVPGDAIVRARAERALRQASLEERLAAERVDLATLELEGARRDRALLEQSATLTRAALHFVEQELLLTSEVRENALLGLEQRELAARREREGAQLDLARAQERRLAAEKRKDGQADPSPTVLAENEALQARQETLQLRVATLGQREERLDELREVYERRYLALAGEVSRPEMREWAGDLARIRKQLELRRRLEEANRAQVTAARDGVRKRADALPLRDPQRRWLEEHARALEDRVAIHREEIADVDDARAIVDRAQGEIERRTARMSARDRIEIALRKVGQVWSTELTSFEERSITVGKVTTAMLVLALGLVLARLLSRVLARLVRGRTSLDEGAVVALQSLGYYALAVGVLLVALRSANIPLTVFTILGGAFAIGVGFGSQNIIANFISGLILLVERPIKVTDMIEVDGTLGQVEGIGLRATRVRTFDNIHIIVPNSAFLEKNVINWNLSDDIVRAQVDVGVAYGSPTRRVEELLLQAANEHRRVLEQPASIVLFLSFGDNALQFRLYFWLHARDLLERRRIESDLRHRIDELLREAGIVIAFPQRDVHLDTSRPLQLEWVGGGSPPET